MAQTLNSYDI